MGGGQSKSAKIGLRIHWTAPYETLSRTSVFHQDFGMKSEKKIKSKFKMGFL